MQSVSGAISHALNTANNGKDDEDGTGHGVPIIASPPESVIVAFAQNNRSEVRLESGHGQVAGVLTRGGRAGYGQPVIASVSLRGRAAGMTAELGPAMSPALRASSGGVDKGHVLAPTFEAYFRYEANEPGGDADWSQWRVRRLMPMECERLQGMPDGYTLVPHAASRPRTHHATRPSEIRWRCRAWRGWVLG